MSCQIYQNNFFTWRLDCPPVLPCARLSTLSPICYAFRIFQIGWLLVMSGGRETGKGSCMFYGESTNPGGIIKKKLPYHVSFFTELRHLNTILRLHSILFIFFDFTSKIHHVYAAQARQTNSLSAKMSSTASNHAALHLENHFNRAVLTC